MPTDAADFYFCGVTKDNCSSPRWRAVKDLGVWQEGLRGRSYKGTGILCTAVYGLEGICCNFWWYGWRTFLQQTETHTRAHTHTHTHTHVHTQLLRHADYSVLQAVYPFSLRLRTLLQTVWTAPHTTRTSKWVSVSRTFWFMRKKHNSRQGVMWVTFHDYISYCLFSLSPLAFSFFVPFCPFLLWSF